VPFLFNASLPFTLDAASFAASAWLTSRDAVDLTVAAEVESRVPHDVAEVL